MDSECHVDVGCYELSEKGHVEECVYSLVVLEEEVDGSKENEESVVRLYQKDVGDFVFKDE